MDVSEIMTRMIAYSKGNLHDVDHLLRVWGYAHTIANQENIDEKTKFIIEVAAIVHDIACPLCRIKYGNTNGKYQEKEGIVLTREFLSSCALEEDMIERIAYLVGHNHTLTNIDVMDYQILIEADFIANATENKYSDEKVLHFINRVMKTESGKRLTKAVFNLGE